jgi:hypothetical protein
MTLLYKIKGYKMSTPEQNANDTQTQVVEQSQATIDYEKRFKDTQASFTKSQQELKAVKAKLDVLEQLTKPTIEIDEAVQQQLEDLKYSDPEAWRQKMNALENDARAKHHSLLSEAEKNASIQAEMERRALVLNEYNSSHPNAPITQELIDFDVPARITKKLETGEISFDDFIVEVHNFIYTPKKVGSNNEVLNQPNLGQMGGGTTPSDGAVVKDIAANYANIAY